MMFEQWYPQLTDVQREVIERMCEGKRAEKLLEEFQILPRTLARWCRDPVFQEALKVRRSVLHLDGVFLLSRNSYRAAEKLVQLMESEKEEVQRKACVDLLKLCRSSEQESTRVEDDQPCKTVAVIDEAKARRVLLEAAKRR